MKTGIEHIAEEREKQLTKWPREHDADQHQNRDLVYAAAYIITGKNPYRLAPDWADSHIGKDEISKLKIAGALIAAEIDRLQNKSI